MEKDSEYLFETYVLRSYVTYRVCQNETVCEIRGRTKVFLCTGEHEIPVGRVDTRFEMKTKL